MGLVLVVCFVAAVVFSVRSLRADGSDRESTLAIVMAAGGLAAVLVIGGSNLQMLFFALLVVAAVVLRSARVTGGRPPSAQGCLTCGAPLQPDDAFCGQCGAGVPAEQRAGTTEPAPALDVGEALAMGASAIWRLLGIAAVLGSIGWYFYAQQASEKQKCDAYHVQHQLTGERPGFPDIVTCFLNGRL